MKKVVLTFKTVLYLRSNNVEKAKWHFCSMPSLNGPPRQNFSLAKWCT